MSNSQRPKSDQFSGEELYRCWQRVGYRCGHSDGQVGLPWALASESLRERWEEFAAALNLGQGTVMPVIKADPAAAQALSRPSLKDPLVDPKVLEAERQSHIGRIAAEPITKSDTRRFG